MDNQVMPREQLGVCAEGNLHSIYLMFNANEGVETDLRPCIANVAQYIYELTDQYADSAFNGFLAVGANYWDSLYPSARPAQLKPFPAMNADNRDAPALEYDLFVHVRCDRFDILHLVANEISQMFEGLVDLVDEERGFRFMDNRDLTGFVDGTENPKGRSRQEVALIGDEDAAFKSGSYIHVQKFAHNLSKWNRLPQKKQEDIIGRTKQDNIEYESADKPLTSHIKRVNLKDSDGKSMEILRQSMPYGSVKEQGLMFISNCRNSNNFEKMLESMVHGDGNGNHDHLLHFTQALTGSSFFAPSLDFMQTKAGI
ncbi:Dyp-type peroxidase [Shewanella psychropiezotolerans]|uniref:Dyp-type peroxidase n=1 Tax=Shewanella psychropiezotolerans TaxID=2593655 RepID=A0ABX5X2H6_9GAMM|nr:MULTISPECIES: Dyp-type peroxidase [Shewanella]MPY23460.1 Dyp-type peroxidase [Shewanella sp. YLB-07]QDO85540.1 Dyp-type peroxidase [Shewanella psychropiezotolerans]